MAESGKNGADPPEPRGRAPGAAREAARKSGGGTMQEGRRLYALRRWELALKEFLSVDASPLDEAEAAELAYYTGLVYTKLGRFEEGLLCLDQVIGAGKEPLRVYQCRLAAAYIYAVTNREKRAESELGHLLKSGFESAQIYTTLAYAAWLQKDSKKAVELYEKALDLDQNNTTAMNGLGFVLVDANIDLHRGLRYCRQAADRKPGNAAYLDSLGWAFYQCGDRAEARQWLRRAQELAPNNEQIREHVRVVTGEAAP